MSRTARPRQILLLFLPLLLAACTGRSQNPQPPAGEIRLEVAAERELRTISPYIYGLNFATEALAAELELPLRRWGGNALSRYDWQGNTTNLASDWYFENVTNTDPLSGRVETADDWVAQNRRTGTASLITVPMLGFVAKDATSCGFSVARYGAQQDSDPYRSDCGNGLRPDGTPLTGNLPGDTSRAVDPGFVGAWVDHLVAGHGSADAGGVRFYALDNEPELWSETHRDVHPQPQSYDELWDRSLAYGQAVKAADPAARLLGFVSFGWSGYWYSQADLVAAAANGYSSYPDLEAHGGRYQVEWYLAQMAAFEQATGTRLLDYLDLHFYPQNGVALTDAGSPERQALRLRSTRALWDPGYRDESWIGAEDQPEDWRSVRLIPRMRAWVAATYPGTGLAISEYNWGGLEHMSGALAQADILGIFGREGVDLAALWNYPEEATGYDRFGDLPGAYAFRMYRNYDGAGGKFGDIAVEAGSSDEGKLALYAARRRADGALTLMVINKTDGPLAATLALSGFTPQATARVYRYGEAAPTAIRREPDQPLGPSGFGATFPPRSITLVVVGKAAG